MNSRTVPEADVALAVAKRFGEDHEKAARSYVATRDVFTYKDIFLFGCTAINVVRAIHFVVNYLRRNPKAKNSDGELDVSGLSIEHRKIAQKVIDEVRAELKLPSK